MASKGEFKRGFTGMTNTRTILLVDDHDVLYRPGTERRLRPLDRHPGGSVLPGRDKPWEIAIGWVGDYRDPITGRYQLWYQAFAGRQAEKRTHRCLVCYAESSDGIHWTKPDLDLYDYNGMAPTNIVMLSNGGYSDRYANSVLVDPRDPDPARRYKMATYDFSVDDDGVERPGLVVAFSPDGIHWTRHPHAPLIRTSYAGHLPTPYEDEPGRPWHIPLTISDAVDAIFDPLRDRFVIYSKMWLDGPDGRMHWKHAMGRTESQDFIRWTKPELVLAPDELDPSWVEFHHSPAFFYQPEGASSAGCYFALLQILHRAERRGIMDIELAISRDGLRWSRPFRGSALSPFFLPRGPEGTFDSGSILSNGAPILLEDEFRFYYGGYAQGAISQSESGFDFATGVGLATMPRDRFASLRPTSDIGQVTLRPRDLTGCREMTINAEASGGSVQVEVLNADGYRVRGFAREDALPITGDGLRLPVRWRGGSTSETKTLADLPAGSYCLRLFLQNADLYAVTFIER
jgi:hypothetical protein